MAKHVGTSAFTHQDDMAAPIHTTHPEHHEAHVYGGEPTEKNPDAVVVLGPPAFGSPDVRTLGHIMHPDHKSESAPALSPEFEAIYGGAEVEAYTEDEMSAMSKADLMEFAGRVGVDVNAKMSKADIIDKIADEHGVAEDEAQEEPVSSEEDDDDSDDDDSEEDDDSDDSQ